MSCGRSVQPIDVSQLVVFHGDLNQNLAHVYVQLSVADATHLRLRGQVRGPRSALTRTLPASIPLTDLGPGPSALARALVPDPCFWEPGQPFLLRRRRRGVPRRSSGWIAAPGTRPAATGHSGRTTVVGIAPLDSPGMPRRIGRRVVLACMARTADGASRPGPVGGPLSAGFRGGRGADRTGGGRHARRAGAGNSPVGQMGRGRPDRSSNATARDCRRPEAGPQRHVRRTCVRTGATHAVRLGRRGNRRRVRHGSLASADPERRQYRGSPQTTVVARALGRGGSSSVASGTPNCRSTVPVWVVSCDTTTRRPR